MAMSLDSMLAQAAEAAAAAKTKVAITAAENEKKVLKVRRKSRELEHEIFGMNLNDVEKLRKCFNEVDTDKSGGIDVDELQVALQRAGKHPSRKQVEALLRKYDADNSGAIDFDEYQKMIKNWDGDLEQIESEEARLAAALKAAEPVMTGACAPSPRIEAKTGSKNGSRRASRDDIPNLSGLDLAKPTAKPARDGSSELTQADRDHIAAQLNLKGGGGGRRRSAVF